MKKTLTVNLGGTVFHIDEDAYQLLDKYLANLRIHFRKEEGSEEIMNDFEMRISELFNERVRLGYEVITIEHVEEVIKRMGKPEELFEGEEEKEYKEEARTQAFQEEEIPRGPKKLMRDPDNRVLGGVAGGIAAYMGWDVTAVRLAMIILLFIPYAPIIILYLILWLVMPLARTAADKLMMRGQSVTLENIGKTVTDGFEKVSNNVNDYMSSDKPRSFLQKLADLFVGVVGFILKFLAILIGIILLPPLLLVAFILVVVTFALIAGGTGFLYQLSPFGANLIAGAPISLAIMGCIGFILLIGIPIFALVYAICMQLFKAKPLPNTAKWTLLILWLVSVVLCVIYFYQTGINGWSKFLQYIIYKNNRIMKKSYSFILVLILMAGLLCSCHINKVSGDGNVVSKEIPIKDYDEIQIEGENVDFKYMQSDDVPYLKVETDQNIMDLLDINTDSKVLVVRPKNRHTGINPTRFIVITNSTALKEFKMAGGGNCDLGKGLNGKKLEIRFAGGGTIKADSIAITCLDCEIAGSGTVSLSGKTEKMNIKSAGSSKIKAFGLETEELTCKAAGSTHIEITANKAISTKIAGSGTIRYKGNPNIKEKSIIGSGSITKVD